MTTTEQFEALRGDLANYHAETRSRFDLLEAKSDRHDIAINGVAGDDTCPGLNVHVNSLLGSRERMRAGIGLAWAALMTIACTLWKK
jgi:hypothetical protein